MKNIVALLFSTLYFISYSHGQSNSFFWEKLKGQPYKYIQVNPASEFSPGELDTMVKRNRIYPIKSGKDLYYWINGTGRLYKLINDSLGKISFIRLDSTEVFGYNFGAYPFTYKNNIYTLGGYGIWRVNGQLRVFNQKAKEWDIIKLNKEIPVVWNWEGGDCMLWYNPESGKIYQAFYYKFNQAVRNENTVIPEVYVLDLQKGEWSKLGNLHVSISSQSGKIKNLAMSPWGLLCFTDFKIFLLSFEKNKIYTLKETAQYKQNLYRAFGNTFFFLDSTLYFTNTKINKLDSIRISLNDFENEGADLYSSSYNYWYITYFVLAALIIAVLFFYLKRKTQKQLFPSNLLLSGSTYLQLEESESEILRLLYENSLANRTTSIDELNKTMGLSKKNTDIQKKQRSDMILSINRKVSLLTNQKEPAIDKQRSDFDKRSFEYFIPVQRIAEVKGLIKEPHPDK